MLLFLIHVLAGISAGENNFKFQFKQFSTNFYDKCFPMDNPAKTDLMRFSLFSSFLLGKQQQQCYKCSKKCFTMFQVFQQFFRVLQSCRGAFGALSTFSRWFSSVKSEFAYANMGLSCI